MILALLLVALGGVAHPDSLSSTEIFVRGHEARVQMRCQVLSLVEVIEGLDADGNGILEQRELALRQSEVLAYISEHYRLTTGTARDFSGGTPLLAEALSAVLLPPDSQQGAPYRMGAVDATYMYRAPAPIQDLMIEMQLFLETSPDHIDITTLTWPDGVSETFALRMDSQRARSDPQGRGAFALFLGLGWHHILSGWDHIAFLVALLFASRSLRALVGVVTAFTLAHSLTLGLAALGWVNVGGASGFIEALIALSIAYVAAETLLTPDQGRTRWPEAFVFGLVHGLGFAGFLSAALLGERSKLIPLAAFNVGVELGQLAIVVVLGLVLVRLPRRATEGEPFIAPRYLRRHGSAVIAVLGLYWFAQRL